MTLHLRRMRKYHPRRTQKEIKLEKENLADLKTKKLPQNDSPYKNEETPLSKNSS